MKLFIPLENKRNVDRVSDDENHYFCALSPEQTEETGLKTWSACLLTKEAKVYQFLRSACLSFKNWQVSRQHTSSGSNSAVRSISMVTKLIRLQEMGDEA